MAFQTNNEVDHKVVHPIKNHEEIPGIRDEVMVKSSIISIVEYRSGHLEWEPSAETEIAVEFVDGQTKTSVLCEVLAGEATQFPKSRSKKQNYLK